MATKALDFTERDPNSINAHVKVSFEDCIAEPDETHSFDCVWQMSFNCFDCCKNCWYKFLSTMCGICLAVMWGCEFATVTFDQVWIITPCLRMFSIYMGCCQKFFGTVTQCFLAPVCETMGLCLSRIAYIKNGP